MIIVLRGMILGRTPRFATCRVCFYAHLLPRLLIVRDICTCPYMYTHDNKLNILQFFKKGN